MAAEAESSVGSSLEKLKTVGLGKGVVDDVAAFVRQHKTDVTDGPLPPDKQTEHSHATLTVKAGPQQPQSDMQAFLASQGWQFDVFICHAEPEKAFVTMLHAEMLKYGLKTFTDVETDGNETQVAEAIVRSPFFMVVVGHNFASSVTCEYEVEAALAFPDIHKKVVPIFYGMSVDECRQMDKQLYHRLASMTALHRGFKTDEQFAEVICQEVKQMAIDQLESNNLKMWKAEGLRIEGSLGQREQLLQLKHALKHSFNFVMESVLDNLGVEGKRHFLEAIAKGTLKIARVNLDMLGDGEAGKSSLGDSLMDEPFIAERESTEGANVIYMIQTATGYGTKWKKDEDRSYSLGCLLARGSVLADDVDKQVNGTESKSVLPQAQSLSGTEENKEGVSISSMRVEDVEASSSMSVKAESKCVSGEGKWSVIFGAKAFEKAKELTEERAQAIKSLQDNPEEVKRQNDFIHISVCDRGGQEPYLPIHMALMGNCSEFIPKAYMLVFDLNKPLNEIVNATFRAQLGANKMPYTRCRQVKNEEIIGRWASAVDLAHPEIQQRSGSSTRPFLGQHRVLRGPAMLIIGTHYDKIIARGEGQQLLNEQEMAANRILLKHKCIEHVVAADAEKNELIFKVDNTRSGTSHPDPMIGNIKKLIFDMAMAYRDDTEATPLPYVVMELGLLYVSQTVGPDGICDSDQKILAIDNVVQLAEEYCDIKGISQCQTALKYLSGVGAIFYFFKAFGLTDKVFTDPQWLFDVMSTFVTILTENQISHLYWYDLKQLKEEGKMSRQLAEHLLERRKQLGVKPKHYNTIFRLLQLIDVFCPHQDFATLALEDVKEFYVPCMLDVDYEELTAWEMSGTTDGSDSTCLPPSLIFKPDNVDYFPEALFFRLSSRTAYQFPEYPQLKRNRIQVYIEDSDLSMELLYHSSCRYVIATIFPNDPEEPPTSEDFNRQCLFVRHFLCWQLNEAKLNGIDGFQWKLFFQCGKKPGTMDVNEESLYCLPEGDEMPKVITNPITKACLKKKERLTVKSWYSCDAPECGGDIATKSYLEEVAESVEEEWRKLAGAMKPRPFYRNELMKFEDVTDDNESGKALRMLQEWQREHKDQATLSNLKRSLAAAKLTHRMKSGHASSDMEHDASESAEHSVEAKALFPTREHSHATLTVKTGPQQPQSPMQVESTPDTTGNVGNKLTLDQLKLVGLGKGVKLMNLSPMKEIVTPDQNNIIRKPSVASNIDIDNKEEFLESKFAKELELSFRTGVPQTLHCSVLFMNGEHRSSKQRRSIHVAKVLSETVDFRVELPHSSSIPFENSLKEAAKKKYSDRDLDDRQRDEICKDVIEKVYQGTTHFISSVELGVMYCLGIEKEKMTGGKKQDVSVSADINTFIKAKLEGGVEIKREELEKKLNVKALEKGIGILGADGKPKETGRIGYKVSPIWSVIQDRDWRKSVERVCSKILPVPVGEKKPIVIRAVGSPPRYLKVFEVDNSAGGDKKQRTSKWRVEGTAEKSEASKIYVVTDEKANDGDGDTVISLCTEIDGERIFLTPGNGILAAKGCLSGDESKFVLVKPENYHQRCDVSEWQRREPLCLRRAERKMTFPLFGFSRPQFVALSTKEGNDPTPMMKRARDISRDADCNGQFLIESVE